MEHKGPELVWIWYDPGGWIPIKPTPWHVRALLWLLDRLSAL